MSMTAHHPALSTQTVETLAQTLISRLWYASLGACAAQIAFVMCTDHTDDERASVLHDQTDRIPLRDRQVYVRTACCWLARYFDASSAGDVAEANRWAERAEAEMERYTLVSCPGCGAAGACEVTCPLRIGGGG